MQSSRLKTKNLEEYLYQYVRDMDDCYKNTHCREAIVKLIEEEGKIIEDDTLVYRGQVGAKTIRSGVDWFSVSRSEEVSRDFTEKGKGACCFFKIHLMDGVKYVDVNKALKGVKYEHKGIYGFEEELIVRGGGYFYADPMGRLEGFREAGEGEYEAWYFQKRQAAPRTPRRSPRTPLTSKSPRTPRTPRTPKTPKTPRTPKTSPRRQTRKANASKKKPVSIAELIKRAANKNSIELEPEDTLMLQYYLNDNEVMES
jgi:hypothetical protein